MNRQVIFLKTGFTSPQLDGQRRADQTQELGRESRRKTTYCLNGGEILSDQTAMKDRQTDHRRAHDKRQAHHHVCPNHESVF